MSLNTNKHWSLLVNGNHQTDTALKSYSVSEAQNTKYLPMGTFKGFGSTCVPLLVIFLISVGEIPHGGIWGTQRLCLVQGWDYSPGGKRMGHFISALFSSRNGTSFHLFWILHEETFLLEFWMFLGMWNYTAAHGFTFSELLIMGNIHES